MVNFMAARFIQDSDYEMQIRVEIKRLLDGSAPGDPEPPLKLLRAEKTAISQIRQWIAGRVDCDTVFSAGPENRDEFMVTITIDIALYHLYSQTGNRDVPEHRKHRYQDALDWLKGVGNGEVTSDLPSGLSDENPGELRLSSRPAEDHRW
jgi:hypothetical protein